MESYNEFMSRINSFEVPNFGIDEHNFTPSESVKQKIGTSGEFNYFYGDTVLFDLTDKEKQMFYHFVNILHSTVPECFGKQLDESTMHMTLHDLDSSPEYESVQQKMQYNQSRLESSIALKRHFCIDIRMHSNFIVNMVNTSVVMCFYPVDEIEYKKLMRLYMIMDRVVKLPYRFTPHVTLAYYNPNGFCYDSAHKLTECVNSLNHQSFDLVLNTERLGYYRFDNMNKYFLVF